MFHWWALGVLVAAIGTSVFHRRRARRSAGAIPRSREGGLMMAGRAAVALPMFGGALAYSLHPAWMEWAAFDAPSWLRWLGVAIGIGVVPSVHWVLSSLGSNVSETVLTKEGQQMVQHGPYRWIRHPLYTTGSAMFIALGLMAANWFLLALACIALIAIRTLIVPREEQELTRRFGKSYQEYRQHTGAMLPRLM